MPAIFSQQNVRVIAAGVSPVVEPWLGPADRPLSRVLNPVPPSGRRKPSSTTVEMLALGKGTGL
jgi:hypothetical protein